MKILPASAFDDREQVRAFNASFRNYVGGEIQMTPHALRSFLASQLVDLELSRVIAVNGQIVAHAYIADFDHRTRLTGLGVIPGFRRKGLARELLALTLEEALHRGRQRYILEVFEQNPEAVALYRAFGFQTVDRLHAYEAFLDGTELEPESSDARPIVPATVPEIARELIRHDPYNLPFQVCGHFLRQLPDQHSGYRLGSARLVVSDPELSAIHIRTLVDFQPEGADARELITRLTRHHPLRQWSISPLLPSRIGDPILLPLGFSHGKTNQLQMEIALTPPAPDTRPHPA